MDRDSRVIIVHHNDLDGFGCATILKAFFKKAINCPVSFYDVEERIKQIEFDTCDHVFVVDVHPDNVETLDVSDKIILIDHHPSTYHNPEKNRFVISDKKKCATYLVWHYLKKTFPEYKFDQFSRFVYAVNEFDIWTNRTPKGKCLNELLYGFYDKDKFITRFKKGNMRFTWAEMGYLKSRRDLFNSIYEDLMIVELEKTKSCLVMSDDFVNDIAHKLMTEEGYDVVFVKQVKKDRVSVRNKRKDINIGKILETLGIGGGHPEAAGFFERDPMTLKEKVLMVEQEILKSIAKS